MFYPVLFFKVFITMINNGFLFPRVSDEISHTIKKLVFLYRKVPLGKNPDIAFTVRELRLTDEHSYFTGYTVNAPLLNVVKGYL